MCEYIYVQTIFFFSRSPGYKMIFGSPGHKMIYLFFLDQSQISYSFALIARPSFHEMLEIQQSQQTTYSKKERKKEKHQNCCFECPWRSPTPRLQISLIRKSEALLDSSDAFDTDLPILLRQVQTTFGTLGTGLSWTESIPTFVDGVPEGF